MLLYRSENELRLTAAQGSSSFRQCLRLPISMKKSAWKVLNKEKTKEKEGECEGLFTYAVAILLGT